MMLPLPGLQPGWLLSESDHFGDPSPRDFLTRLDRRRWRIERFPSESPGDALDCDLLFIELPIKEPDVDAALNETVSVAIKNSVPVLFHGPAALLATIGRRCGLAPVPLTPDELPYWWGPERMDEELIRNTPSLPITSVTLGRYWAAVETGGSMGLAAMAHRSSAADDTAAPFDPATMIGVPLSTVATGLRQLSGMARTLACAAVNAGIPAPPHAVPGDGLLSDHANPGRRTVIVGRFPALQAKRPGAIVLEMSPGPDDLPADAAAYVIPGAGELLVTASAWCNGTLPGLLRLAKNVPVTLVGPGTPLSPALHAYGIRTLGGFKPVDRDAIRSVIANGGGVKAFKKFGEQILLSAE
ncbi:DUF364 domain-containing protein [Nisaea sp.]|uniref:Rossmann-like domain-containing protein n=1 Tax=Nisaea sp. TaxID=2024842 RepID=UPI0032ED8837